MLFGHTATQNLMVHIKCISNSDEPNIVWPDKFPCVPRMGEYIRAYGDKYILGEIVKIIYEGHWVVLFLEIKE